MPEIWRVYKSKVEIYLLEGQTYTSSSVSRAFPFLTAQTISEFLVKGIIEGERKAARAFREWLRQRPEQKS
ncbi:MAG: hypothetical protein HY231_17780 [Acidobacteria bacterium]|nr:hypothetical protein [Acidobacteriota bacterium]